MAARSCSKRPRCETNVAIFTILTILAIRVRLQADGGRPYWHQMSRISKFVAHTSLALLATTAGACIMAPQGPKSGAVASGAPLAVVDDVKVWTTQEKEKVGETEYKDENGQVFGKSTTYQDKQVTHSMKVWYPVQGNEQLSDEDFFHIAGDQKAYDETLAMRTHGKKWQRRGVVAMVGGGIGMVASFFISNAPVKVGLSVVGGLVLGGGYYMSYLGAHEMNPETHAVDRSLADRAANQYNAHLGQVGGLSMGKQF